MEKGSSSSGRGDISFIGLLTVLFIGLKLTGYIHWSWWWVLSPVWIVFVFIVAIFVGTVLWEMIKGR